MIAIELMMFVLFIALCGFLFLNFVVMYKTKKKYGKAMSLGRWLSTRQDVLDMMEHNHRGWPGDVS